MRPRTVAVRCFAEQSTAGWVAHCVELGLTVKGDSLERVKRELDALVHRQLDDQLVRRRPTLRAGARSARSALALHLRYWGLLMAGTLGLRRDALRDRVHQRRVVATRTPSRAW
jgi:hypothetical protein